MTVRFHPAARVELREALLWYDERSPISAAAFGSELESAIQRIAAAPLRYPIAQHETRRLLLSRFPYSVFYRILPHGVVIIAVAHHKRRPGYWRDRSKQT